MAVDYLVQDAGRCWGWVTVEVEAAYDLTRRSDLARLDISHRLAHIVREQGAFLDRLVSGEAGETFGLRILRERPGLLRVWLLARTAGKDVPAVRQRADELLRLLEDVPPQIRVVRATHSDAVAYALNPFKSHPEGLAQIGKRLRIHDAQRPDAQIVPYLGLEPFSREATDWTPLLASLSRAAAPVALTVILAPTELSRFAMSSLESEATRYGRLKEPWTTTADVGGIIQYPGDRNAGLMEPIFVDAVRRYSGRVFRFAVTMSSPEPLENSLIEAAGRTISPAPSDKSARHDPATVATGYQVVRPQSTQAVDQLRHALSSLEPLTLPDPHLASLLVKDRDTRRAGLAEAQHVVDREEASSLFRLPIALAGNIPGLRVVTPPDAERVVQPSSEPVVTLGYQGGGTDGPVTLPIADLPRHGFIVGTPGSGKTNTALNLCQQLGRSEIPFLVLEPVNAELDDYRWLATQGEFEKLLVFTVGDEGVAPFRLNPFEIPGNGTISAHISNLLACFEAAFGLWDPLPFIYRRALVRTYRARGLHPDDRASSNSPARWPILEEFVGHLSKVTAELGYDGEVGHNIDAAARLRAEALIEGACGTTLNCRRSFDLTALLSQPTVIELSGVGDNAKEQSLVTLMLLMAIRSHRRSQSRPSPHVVFIEEAHRIFPRATPRSSGDMKEANAQAIAAERIAQGLAEDRKYFQSYMLIDQQVGKVAEDAYKITNLKVMHRTAALEDRQLLGSTMNMQNDQIESAAALAPFEAVISHNHLAQPVTVQVPNVRANDAVERGLNEAPIANNADLQARFQRYSQQPNVLDAMAPYDECHDCRNRCAFKRRVENLFDAETAIDLLEIGRSEDGGLRALTVELTERARDGLAAIPYRLTSENHEDYLVCAFIHALRLADPPSDWVGSAWTDAIAWVDAVRTNLRQLAEAEQQSDVSTAEFATRKPPVEASASPS